MGAGLPAMAVCQAVDSWAGPPLSQASQLPHFAPGCVSQSWPARSLCARSNTGASTICPSI
ncbi:hypothetical protein FEM54_24470 [Pseudomonas edaphica]|uniref:Uncharacterized protein n=1 Tax=Pseudomonas edaphica TaxID=2006980 RepID=A0ABY2U425_9PSED|nr:hypothetical protein FEM54_24470 [Pseudomonas edaphica]